MRLKGSFWVAVFFLALGLFGIIQSLTFHYWESIALPLAISVVIFILAAVAVIKELYRRGEEATTERKSEGGIKEKFNIKRIGVVFGWAVGFCLAIYLLGFYISIPVFAFAYLKWRRRSWLTAIIFALALLAFSYAIFTVGLKVPLYDGLFFGAH